MNREKYKTEEYNATKGFLILLITFMLSMILLIFIGVWLKDPSIGVIGFICVCILPFVFEKKIKQIFTKSVLLEFDDISFSITQYRKKNNAVSKQLHLPWADIKSYSVYFSPEKHTILTLHLRNGFPQKWNFKDNKTSDEAINGESLFKMFYSYIQQYNIDKDETKKIDLTPGFLNSKLGTAIIYFEIALIVFAFILHLIFHPQSSFLTLLMGVGLTLQQYFKRKNEKNIYDKISKLE